MKLSSVTLERDRRIPGQPGEMRKAFRTADGYGIEIRDGMLLLSKGGVTTIGSATWITDGLTVVDDEPTQPSTPQAKAK